MTRGENDDTKKEPAAFPVPFSITRIKGRIMFRTERSKRTGGTYFLDEELIRMIGNEFRSSGAYMQAQRWDYSETEHPQLKNILKYLYEKGTVFYRVANERREYSLKTGKKNKDPQTINDSGIIMLNRGSRLNGTFSKNDTFVTAVRRSLDYNIASLDDDVKKKFLKSFDDVLAEITSGISTGKKRLAKGFETTLEKNGFKRKETNSVYKTIGHCTVRVSNHSATMSTFLENGESGNDIIVVAIKPHHLHKKFKEDPRINGVEYVFKEDDFNKHPGKMLVLLHDIGTFFATGKYFDNVGAIDHHYSGTEEFKEEAKRKVETDDRIRRERDAIHEKGEMSNAVKQKYGSGNTSLRQVAAGFKKIEFQPGTVNLDLGGGKYDEGTKYLAERGVKNLVFDPVNRDSEHNQQIFEAVKNGGVDTVTCNNVLNVIKESAARDNVILQCAKALKPGGTAYFTVYEGDGNGTGRQSQADSWQEHRKTADYMEEIKRHFKDVFLKNKVITAREPLTDGKLSAWAMDPTFENPRMYSLRRRQVNPIIEDKALQEEYAEELSKNEYTPETLEQWDREAVKWILRNGGILGAVEKIIGQTEHAAVPQMIEKGKIFDRQKNWKERGYDTVVMVAPLEIGGIPYVGEVVVE